MTVKANQRAGQVPRRAGPHLRGQTRCAVHSDRRGRRPGRPVRDPGSSSYFATLQAVEHFASLVYAEARGRGGAQAGAVVVLGDGAPWIWNLVGLSGGFVGVRPRL